MDFKNYNIVDGFNFIAPAYDLANDAMTFGMHRLWRRNLCKLAAKLTPKGGKLLDVATGTGDVLLGMLKRRSDISAIGVDPSDGMLKVAREKLSKKAALFSTQAKFELGDARKLAHADGSFDTVTVSWGIRNVKPFSEGIREMKRVLKPGGWLLVLESGQPELKLVGAIYKHYARLLPFIGEKISGFRPAYQYYTHTVENFPSGANFVAELYDAGYTNVSYKTLGGSIVYLYRAQKPVK